MKCFEVVLITEQVISVLPDKPASVWAQSLTAQHCGLADQLHTLFFGKASKLCFLSTLETLSEHQTPVVVCLEEDIQMILCCVPNIMWV